MLLESRASRRLKSEMRPSLVIHAHHAETSRRVVIHARHAETPRRVVIHAHHAETSTRYDQRPTPAPAPPRTMGPLKTHPRMSPWSGRLVASGLGQASGSRTVNVVPAPRPALAAATEPPIASTSDLVIARPRPLPPAARERDGSAR